MNALLVLDLVEGIDAFKLVVSDVRSSCAAAAAMTSL
jgi:hypothetical protein